MMVTQTRLSLVSCTVPGAPLIGTKLWLRMICPLKPTYWLGKG